MSSTGMNVLITGANTGIGFETALELAKDGHCVYIGCRSETKGKETVARIKKAAKTDQVFFTGPLELGSLKAVRDFAQDFAAKVPELDVLICNAGIMGIPKFTETVDGFESHFAVNHLGHHLLIQMLLPNLMRAFQVSKRPSRIVNVASDAYLWGRCDFSNLPQKEDKPYDENRAYGVSKLCNILETLELNRRFVAEAGEAQPPIIAYSLHPGVIQTELTRHMGLKGTLAQIALKLLRFFSPSSQWAMKTPQEGAATTLYCVRKAPSDRLEPSQFPNFYREQQYWTKLKKHARNEQDAARLFDLSEQLIASKL